MTSPAPLWYRSGATDNHQTVLQLDNHRNLCWGKSLVPPRCARHGRLPSPVQTQRAARSTYQLRGLAQGRGALGPTTVRPTQLPFARTTATRVAYSAAKRRPATACLRTQFGSLVTTLQRRLAQRADEFIFFKLIST